MDFAHLEEVEEIREWPRHAAYKDSGLEWLGEVPEHWQVERLKTTVNSLQNGIWGDEPASDDTDIACIRVADFDRVRNRVSDVDLTVRSIPARQRGSRELHPGDLLIEKSGGGELQPVGQVVLYDLEILAVCSNFIAKMEVAHGYDPNYLCYLHTTLYHARLNTRSIKQTTGIQNLDSTSYLDERVALPSLAEQHAIAAFLDAKTAQIDASSPRKSG